MIKDRIIQVIENKGIPKEIFYKKIGMTSANFRGEAKKTPLNSTAIENILSEIPEINPDWLLTGKGEMLRQTAKTPHISEGIPLIPVDAMAGYLAGSSTQVMEYECERYVIPHFKGAEFLIAVKGSSMYPKYNSGDIVACKRLPLDTFFQWNKVYVLDTEQGALIKRVKKSSSEDKITIVSDNPAYEPFEISKEKVNALALVIGVIRLE